MSKNLINNFIKDNFSIIKLVSFFIALASFFVVYDNYIIEKIDDRIKNPSYVGEISKNLRPYLIFNDEGVIVYEHGGSSFIDSIGVEQEKGRWLKSITVYSNQFLNSPPLLDYIGVYHYSYETIRLKNYTWLYKLRAIKFLTLEESGEPLSNFFILEILN